MFKDRDPKRLSFGECSCCGYKTVLIRCTEGTGEKHDFCEVCYSTYLSNHITYPRSFEGDASLHKSVGFIANMILDAVDPKRRDMAILVRDQTKTKEERINDH